MTGYDDTSDLQARIAELEGELADLQEGLQVAHQIGYAKGYADGSRKWTVLERALRQASEDADVCSRHLRRLHRACHTAMPKSCRRSGYDTNKGVGTMTKLTPTQERVLADEALWLLRQFPRLNLEWPNEVADSWWRVFETMLVFAMRLDTRVSSMSDPLATLQQEDDK